MPASRRLHDDLPVHDQCFFDNYRSLRSFVFGDPKLKVDKTINAIWNALMELWYRLLSAVSVPCNIGKSICDWDKCEEMGVRFHHFGRWWRMSATWHGVLRKINVC